MANIKSAMKRHRQSLKRRASNRLHKGTMRSQIKKLLTAIASGDKDAASQELTAAYSKIDKTRKHGPISKNKANRLKSRLGNRFNKAFSA